MRRGIVYALASAALFGASTPIAKALVAAITPQLLAGLLYAGSGIGLALALLVRHVGVPRTRASIAWPRGVEWAWLAGAIVLGGIIGPVALMIGLAVTPASTASLLLNLESVLTAVIAWVAFRENVDRRVALGMACIAAGGVALAWSPDGGRAVAPGALAIVAACVCWALDNNLTRRVAGADALLVAALKGLFAGGANLAIALGGGATLPSPPAMLAAGTVGFLGYGVSLALFVLALRALGTARAGAYFAVAPFFGAVLAVAITGDALTWPLVVAGALMAVGTWLHVVERHAHVHAHQALQHTHAHVHDEHHRHDHDLWDGREPHTHAHVHAPLVHAHAHYPDLHHRHPH